MNAEAQKQFFEHVRKIVERQAAIRPEDTKSLRFDVGLDLQRFFQWGFITLKQREILEQIKRA